MDADFIAAPEFLVFTVIDEFLEARVLGAEFANISQLAEWSLVHGFLLSLGGISLQTACGKYFRPSIQHFLDLVNGKVEIVEISKDEIEDKSKTSGVAKALALVQTLWFALGVLVPGIRHMPIATLELFTVAMVCCSVMIYACWWHKPRDIQRPFVFKLDESISLKDLEVKRVSGGWYKGCEAAGQRISLDDDNHSDFIASIPKLVWWGVLFAVNLCLAPWHLLGWNTHFNTQVEQSLWRFSSVGCTVLPLLGSMSVLLEAGTPSSRKIRVVRWLSLMEFYMYILMRLYLLGECLANLRAVPVRVYESIRRLDIIPHIGS